MYSFISYPIDILGCIQTFLTFDMTAIIKAAGNTTWKLEKQMNV